MQTDIAPVSLMEYEAVVIMAYFTTIPTLQQKRPLLLLRGGWRLVVPAITFGASSVGLLDLRNDNRLRAFLGLRQAGGRRWYRAGGSHGATSG